jgi:D-aminoacyl-tRNA deacylase
MILLVHSTRDIAGVNIAQHLLQRYPFTETSRTYQENPVYNAEISGKNITFVTLSEESINAQTLPEHFPNAELVVFISRHSSQSGTPTLSVHTPGNFDKAELGGLPRTLSVSPANAMADALNALNRLRREMNLDYEVSYECTHHGPSLKVPAMFVELGSSEKQWRDQKAADAVAQAAMEAIANFGKTMQPAVLGIGGPHYSRKFTQMALDGKAVFGHMIPKYAISTLDLEILHQCVDKTLEIVQSVVFDWKGVKSEDKPRLLSDLQEIGLFIQKV